MKALKERWNSFEGTEFVVSGVKCSCSGGFPIKFNSNSKLVKGILLDLVTSQGKVTYLVIVV